MKLFKFLTKDIFNAVGKVIDDLFTSDEERLQARNQIFKALSEQSFELDKLKSDIIRDESKGNFLQRSWRPIVMLSFAFIVLYSKFFAPAFGLPNTVLEPDFWGLLKLGIGGYVIGRSGEKMTKYLAKNISIKKTK